MTGRTRLQGAVGALRERPLPAAGKGLGLLTAAGPVTAASLAARRPSLFGPELTMPLLVLKQDALAHNVGAMARYCAQAGVLLAPHGKTTMAPQIVARQIEAGAWGVTAATLSQVQVFREFGVERVLLANELTEPAAVGWLAAELAADPGFDCYVYADSLDGVRLLAEGVRAAGGARPLPVLVELGQRGGRTGCRSAGQAQAVASAVTAAPGLRLAGVAGYEGSIGHDREPATVTSVAAFCRELRALAARLAPPEARGGAGAGGAGAGGAGAGGAGAGGENQYLITAGGSLYFDVVVAELTAPAGPGPAPVVVLRSGAYVTHDHGIYARLTPAAQPGGTGPALVPALELWARVLSVPEPGLAIAGAGRRDAPFDQGLPVPLRIRRADGQEGDAAGLRVTALDDQHAYLQLPAGCELHPGDLVCLGISHPCTAFDKWQLIPVVDEDYRVTDIVRTFF